MTELLNILMGCAAVLLLIVGSAILAWLWWTDVWKRRP
jgi:hypothetical protein